MATQPLPANAAGLPGEVGTVNPPLPAPLGRETRDPHGAARIAAQQQADHEQQLRDSAAPRPGQEFQNARVLPGDLGLAFLPQSAQDVASSTRTFEPGSGSTVSTVLRSANSLASALAFYRQELRSRLPQAQLVEEQTAPDPRHAVGLRRGQWRAAVGLPAQGSQRRVDGDADPLAGHCCGIHQRTRQRGPRQVKRLNLLRTLMGVCALLATLTARAETASPAERGRLLYETGADAQGRALRANRVGAGALPREAVACVQCHRPSTMGGIEGGLWVPPVAGHVLFAPASRLR